MEVIANSVTNSLMELQLKTATPIIFGVLTTLSLEQATERAESALPKSWADSALCMAKQGRAQTLDEITADDTKP